MDLFFDLRGPVRYSLPPGRVLVLAPHADDDVIGCGGALAQCRSRGDDVTVVYMTDGRKGGTYRPEGELAVLRREEARRGAAELGVDDLVFLGHPDGELRSSAAAGAEVADILSRSSPDLVFLPFVVDNHPDHLATNEIFATASRAVGRSMLCCGYEVWTPLSAPNCILNIKAQLPAKVRALEQHHSQLQEADLVSAALGMSQYRAATSDVRKGNAEAFVCCTAAEYRRLWEVAADGLRRKKISAWR